MLSKKIGKAIAASINLLAMAAMIYPLQPARAEVINTLTTSAQEDASGDQVSQTLTSGKVIIPVSPEIEIQIEDKNTASLNWDAEFTTHSYPYKRTFIISAYYSPIKGQDKYVTGSYSGDIRLNGGGVHGADGTEVYPGMIAAPKGYDFGIKMNIPGLGVAAVHDRGGAIVHSGQRNNAHDRLDVWMGFGDAGRSRAMKWGKRTIEVTVLGKDSSIKEYIALDGFTMDERYNVSNTLTANNTTNNPVNSTSTDQTTTAKENLVASLPSQPVSSAENGFKAADMGDSGDHVKKLQQALKELNYYQGEINSSFDKTTAKAVTKFQLNEKIITQESSYGAGVVGPKTLKLLSARVTELKVQSKQQIIAANETFGRDMKLGDSGDDVRTLQKELKNLHLLGINPTGYYGDVTAHAVFKFQQINGLVGDKESVYAGVLGPVTRSKLNSLLAKRASIESVVAVKKQDDLS